MQRGQGPNSGTGVAPTQIVLGDVLGTVNLQGRDDSSYVTGASIEASATEDWGAGLHGTRLSFKTTASAGAGGLAERMTITDAGNVGVGTPAPGATLQAHSETSPSVLAGSYFADDVQGPSLMLAHARGTGPTPEAVWQNDVLGVVSTVGYDGTTFADGAAIMAVASENWTNVPLAHGTRLAFYTTGLGSATPTHERPTAPGPRAVGPHRAGRYAAPTVTTASCRAGRTPP